MDRQVTGFWVVAATVVVACTIVAYAIAPASNQSFADAAAVITFASLLAVGIERVVELGWLVIDAAGRFGGYFPLNVLMKQFEEVDRQTDTLLGRVFDDTRKALQNAIEVGGRTGAEIDSIKARIAELDAQRATLTTRLSQIRTLSPGSGRLGATAAIADQISASMHQALGTLGAAGAATRLSVVTVRSSAQTALEVIGALGDNPSRRIASLLFSSALGMLVAGMVGVNLFEGILQQSQGPAEAILFGKLGVVVTGVVVGLGSGPTHEVIKGLQRYKDSRGRTAIADLSTDLAHAVTTAGAAIAPSTGTEAGQLSIRSTH
jgi:hypothetical protein